MQAREQRLAQLAAEDAAAAEAVPDKAAAPEVETVQGLPASSGALPLGPAIAP